MSQAEYTVFEGGTIIDGSGNPSFPGEVVIQGERIVSVGRVGTRPVAPQDAIVNVIDCAGYAVAPGFIDAHSHSDLQVLQNRTEKLLQGVTTEVVGNCGFSAYPLPDKPELLREFANGILYGDERWGWNSASDYLSVASESKTATVVSLVGHGSLRIKVAGNTSRALTARELDLTAGLLDEALQEGAAGFSSGLKPPDAALKSLTYKRRARTSGRYSNAPSTRSSKRRRGASMWRSMYIRGSPDRRDLRKCCLRMRSTAESHNCLSASATPHTVNPSADGSNRRLAGLVL